jgi:DNA-binding PadR family transcriptional regulator
MPGAQPSDPRDFLPLSQQVFQVLLSLADGPQHGYAIITDIETRTTGEMRLTASTLYDALARLLDQDLIEELDRDDSRRRSYRLTKLGRSVAEAEARRLERLLAMAREKQLLKGRR